ncbi:MAG: hypothetical protein CBC35_07275 [Planctomycetes bacterium TMED75]|nr:MAG: hypothetical protein CBC35_07275 [Planctomycetes bacterium TMED75]
MSRRRTAFEAGDDRSAYHSAPRRAMSRRFFSPERMAMSSRLFLKLLIVMCLVEGISTLVLFGVAMPMKYYAGRPEWVSVVGSLHGMLFLLVVAMFLVGRWLIPLTGRLTVLGLVGAIFPLVPFWVDVLLLRVLREMPPETS